MAQPQPRTSMVARVRAVVPVPASGLLVTGGDGAGPGREDRSLGEAVSAHSGEGALLPAGGLGSRGGHHRRRTIQTAPPMPAATNQAPMTANTSSAVLMRHRSRG